VGLIGDNGCRDGGESAIDGGVMGCGTVDVGVGGGGVADASGVAGEAG
jgi:hypothetical protein